MPGVGRQRASFKQGISAFADLERSSLFSVLDFNESLKIVDQRK